MFRMHFVMAGRVTNAGVGMIWLLRLVVVVLPALSVSMEEGLSSRERLRARRRLMVDCVERERDDDTRSNGGNTDYLSLI